MLDHQTLLATLHYAPETGIWTRLRQIGSRGIVGARADRLMKSGYRDVAWKGKRYLSRRLAWFYVTGSWPVDDIDHKNTNKADNKWSNLRPSNDSQNLGNRGKQKNNTSGYKGVYWQKTMCAWCAEIVCEGKKYRLGYALAAVEAHKLYCEAASKLFGEFARHA